MVVGVGFPYAYGFLCSALQQASPGHQSRPHTGGTHVHSDIIHLSHEELRRKEEGGAEGPEADY